MSQMNGGYSGKLTVVRSERFYDRLYDSAFANSRGRALAEELTDLLLHRREFSITHGIYHIPLELRACEELCSAIDPNEKKHRLLNYELYCAKRVRQLLDVEEEEILFVQRIKIRRKSPESIYIVRLEVSGTVIGFDESHTGIF